MIDIKTFTKPKKSGNGSGGSSTTYVVGTATEAEHATRADKAKKADYAEQAGVANRSTSALSANYAATAGDVNIEADTLQKFMRKDAPAEGEEDVIEEVERKVGFKKETTFEQAVALKEAVDMLKGFTAHELAAFMRGFTIGSNGYGFDEDGNVVANSMETPDFDQNEHAGFSLKDEGGSKYHLSLSNLTVWGKMMLHTLEIMQTKYAGGNIYLSAAGCTFVKVAPVRFDDMNDGEWVETTEELCEGWKCYFIASDGDKTIENPWSEGDQVRCQSMGSQSAGSHDGVTNKSYWRTIPENGVSVSGEYLYSEDDQPLYDGKKFHWIVLGKHTEDIDGYTEDNAPSDIKDTPADGDVVVLDGNKTDTSRQGVMIFDSCGENAPCIVGLHGVKSYSHARCTTFELSYEKVRMLAERFELIAGDGSSKVEIPNFRGMWLASSTYYPNDQVSHGNAIWTCLKQNSASEPSDSTSDAWRKEVYGVKGDKGDTGTSYMIVPSCGAVKVNKNGRIVITDGLAQYDSSCTLAVIECTLYKMENGTQEKSESYWEVSKKRYLTSPYPGTISFVVSAHDASIEVKAHEFDVVNGRPTMGDLLATLTIPVIKDGATGAKGDKGDQGEKGDKGDQGEKGDQGDQGVKGDQGEKGDPGKDGVNGIDGTNGKDGKDGKDGIDGKDAISIVVSDAPLVFDTGSDGIVPTNVSKSAKVKVMKGATDVTADVTLVSSSPATSVNCMPIASKTTDSGGTYIQVTISGSYISRVCVDDSDDSKGQVSVTSGYATGEFHYDGTKYTFQVPFEVNVSKFTGKLLLDTKKFSTEMTELSSKHTKLANDYNTLAADLKTVSPSVLTQYTSKIEQTAREISLSVSEKAAGRRNMLPGSALRRKGEGCEVMSTGYISCHGGIDGVHAFCADMSVQYTRAGLRWVGGGKSCCVKVTRGHTYVLSMWVKASDTAVAYIMEAIYQGSKNDSTRPSGYNGPCNNSGCVASGTVATPNTWQLVKRFFTVPSSIHYEYLEIFLHFYTVDNNHHSISICKPMLEEGNAYNGWTLSSEDYDFVGGNIIDRSRTLVGGENVLGPFYGTLLSKAYNSESSVVKTQMLAMKGTVDSLSSLPSSPSVGDRYGLNSDWTIWEYDGNSLSDSIHYNGWCRTSESLHQDFLRVRLDLEIGKDYIISWYAKCDSNGYMGVCITKNGDNSVFGEWSDGISYTSIYGENAFVLTPQWKRYWVHFRLIKGKGQYIIFRQYRGNAQESAPAMTVYMSQPKIEEGCTMTEWTEKRTDLVDRQALLDTGIDITNKKLTATADNFIVRSNSGIETLAINSDGTLNTNLLKAKALSTYGSGGIHIEIENGLMQCFGTSGIANTRFGIDDDGYSILSFYDNEGRRRYDLGPNGMKAASVKSEKVETLKVCSINAVIGSDVVFYDTVTRGTGASAQTFKKTKFQYDTNIFGTVHSIMANLYLYDKYDPTEGKVSVTLYKYTAARLEGTALKSEKYGLTTAALADAADGKYFTSQTMGSGGSLTNLANGKYFIYGRETHNAPCIATSPEGSSAKWPIMSYSGYIEFLNGRISTSLIYSYYENDIDHQYPSAQSL